MLNSAVVWGKSASTWVNIRKGLHHFFNDYTYLNIL